MKLVHLVDSQEYARANCWQHQIYDALRTHFGADHVVRTLQETLNTHVPDCDVILSTLRLRTVYRNVDQLASFLGGRKVCVYDQDPWEAFIDQGSFRGAYGFISRVLNVSTFINASSWWTNYVVSQGFCSSFVRMWLKTEYCSCEPKWRSRPIKVGFMGTLHPHRRAAIERLEAMGVHVEVLPSASYHEWLKKLSTMQFFFHEESGDPWSIDGEQLESKQFGWSKDIEAAARGCVVLRQFEEESSANLVKIIPAIVTYDKLEEVPGLIEKYSGLNNIDDIVDHSANVIRSVKPWSDLINVLEVSAASPKR